MCEGIGGESVSRGQAKLAGAVSLAMLLCWGAVARADQGGVSFWVPGIYASMAAVPPDPGFSMPSTFYFYSGKAESSRNFAIGGLIATGVEVKTEDGASSRILIGARPLRGDSSGGFVLANGANGELYLIRLRLNVVRKRKIRQEGTCNFMPSPVRLEDSTSMFVVPVAVVRTVDVTYEGEDTEVTCDERVE